MSLPEPPADYPAAHSMDSTWYAVDEDGLVAEFDTGEAGALPHAAAYSGEGSSFDDELLRALLLARNFVGDEQVEYPDERTDPSWPQVIIVVMEADPPAAAGYRDAATPVYSAETLLADLAPIVVREDAPRIVVTGKKVKPKHVAEIEKHPRVRRVLKNDEITDLLSERPVTFRFGNDAYDAPGAYVRDAVPETPFQLDELPETLREVIGRIRLPVHFAEMTELDLNDYMTDDDVQVWGGGSMKPGADATEEAPPPPRRAPRRPVALVAGGVALVAAIALAIWLSG